MLPMCSALDGHFHFDTGAKGKRGYAEGKPGVMASLTEGVEDGPGGRVNDHRRIDETLA